MTTSISSVGRLQVRLGGGLAGHNGLRSIAGTARQPGVPPPPGRGRSARPRRSTRRRRLRARSVRARGRRIRHRRSRGRRRRLARRRGSGGDAAARQLRGLPPPAGDVCEESRSAGEVPVSQVDQAVAAAHTWHRDGTRAARFTGYRDSRGAQATLGRSGGWGSGWADVRATWEQSGADWCKQRVGAPPAGWSNRAGTV